MKAHDLVFFQSMFCRVGAKGVVIIPGYTATSRKVVRKNVHVKGNMGYDQYSVSDTTAVEVLTFVAFTNTHPWPLLPFFHIALNSSELKTTHNTLWECHMQFI